MPTKIFKNSSDVFPKFFQANLNNTIETSAFSKQLKYAHVKPVFKEDCRTDNKNYRLISVLLMYLKIM